MSDLTPDLPPKEIHKRQCTRHRVELHFRLGGKDEQGAFFEEEVVTRDLSECGGCFSSNRPIKIGTTLSLADHSGFISMIHITWGNVVDQLNISRYGFRFLFPLEE
ncbi:MAG: hypothetical protein U0V70_11460 [Terriglobia bacterium]